MLLLTLYGLYLMRYIFNALKMFILVYIGLLGYKFFFVKPYIIPFVYALKTKPATTASYLPESNSRILKANNTTVGVYSKKKSHFLLKEILQTAGIPYIFSNSLTSLKDTAIIFLDFNIDTPITLSSKDRDFLYAYVKKGGIIIGEGILPTRNGALKELFGYKSYNLSDKHKIINLLKSDYYKYFDNRYERHYALSHLNISIDTNSIELGTSEAIATYEDNTTAISLNHYGKGIAFNIGISLYNLRYRNLIDKDFQANKEYINGFESLSDFIILFIKGIYESSLDKSITLHTSKDGCQATVIMTHNINTINSMKNIPKFTALEDKLGFKATYNIETKYISDNKDMALFLPKYFHYFLDAQKDGYEIGVDTELHSKNFFLLSKGSCKESYPTYKPFALANNIDIGNPSVCGDVKVSKELLLGAGVKDVVSFRSDELLYNPKLPEVLEKFGYRYSSCFSSEDILSYFPYRYMKDYAKFSNPSKIWEIPLTLEDKLFPPLYFRVDDTLKLFKKIYNNGAVFTILNHTDSTFPKGENLDLGFIKKFYSKLPADVWKTTIKDMGEYWDKRDRVVFRYKIDKQRLLLTVHSLSDINGLTFKLNGFLVKPIFGVYIRNHKLVIDVKKGINRFKFKLSS